MDPLAPSMSIDIKTLLATIGELTVVNSMLKQKIAELEARQGEATNKKPERRPEVPA